MILLRRLFLIFICIISNGHASVLEFKGYLLDRPCQSDPSTTSLDVSFMNTAIPLYQTWPGKSYEKKFQIKLVNCHASTIGKVVELVFNGKEEAQLPGYLEVNGVNRGKLGIGIIDTDGFSFLRLNQIQNNRKGNLVTNDSVIFEFKAFVQATPEAIAKKNIQIGTYSSTVRFVLSYK
ncbi:type 1 fimbrial protein [Escherichia coli]|nr:type 1 fimbrial protein [Escherichia coli]HBJ0986513.1 type 1 fimbrial protein [Escherichia coli]